MGSIAADALYEASYRSSWGAVDGPLGHLVIRRLDDHEVVAEIPAETEEAARELIARADTDIRGNADEFESAWGIGADRAADPGPDILRPHAADAPKAVPDREPQPGERIIGPDPRIAVLPSPAEVFAADQPWLARVLHPLVSVELSAFDPAWSGRVHLLSPVEPAEGLLGERTAEHHDDFACENWISFRVGPDGCSRFLGRPAFFEIEAVEASAAADSAGAGECEHVDELAALHRLYAEAEAEAEAQLADTRTRWERLGRLVWGDERDPTQQREGWGTDIAILDELGGAPGSGNWAAFPPPAAFALDQGEAGAPILRLADGRPFTYIGSTAGYPWREEGADGILLFFEPETRTAALTFDWS